MTLTIIVDVGGLRRGLDINLEVDTVVIDMTVTDLVPPTEGTVAETLGSDRGV